MRLLLTLLAFTAVLSAQTLVGDGQADDTVALQKLVDTQGSVRLPKGRYKLTKTVTVDLAKTGYAAVSSDGTAQIIMAGPGPALHFIGTHDKSADPWNFKPAVWQNQRAPSVSGIEIIGAHPAADGIEATGTMQLTIQHVLIRECRHAIHLTKLNRNVIISACNLYHNSGIGVFLDDVNLHQINVAGSHISYNGGGGIVSRGGNVRNLQIGTCDIEANHDAKGKLAANVELDSTGGSIGEVTITGCTIQHTNKAPGSANIRILGAGKDESLIRRGGRPTTREGNVTITGNVFSDVQVNVEIKNARGVTVSANTFWEGFERDIVIEDSSNLVISGNNFDRNPRYLVNGNNLAEKNGIVLSRVTDSSFSDNIISGVHGHEAAMDVTDCSRLRITNNSILDSDGAALRLTRLTRSLVTGNLLRDDRPADQRSKSPRLIVTEGSENRIEADAPPAK
jgi:hypothetical protein